MADVSKIRKKNSSKYRKHEKNRGRLETRTLWVFKATDEVKKYMSHCASVILVHRQRTQKGKTSDEYTFYISNLVLTAKKFFDGIRGHWSIENRLHYVKDVVLNEDKANLKNKKIAPFISILRSFAISIAYIFSNSVTSFQRTYTNNLDLIGLFGE